MSDKMAVQRVLLLVVSGAVCVSLAAGIIGNVCFATSNQQWAFHEDGTISSIASGQCLTASAMPITDGTPLEMQRCSGAASQIFRLVANNNTIVAGSDETKCINLSGYGTSPGTQVWLFTCDVDDCKGNCDWTSQGGTGNSTVTNPESGLCLDDGASVFPRTCAPGSAEASLPFCNYSLPLENRVDDLVGRLSLQDKIALFSNPIKPAEFNASLNLKSFFWDITCIHGLSPGIIQPNPNVTAFPHAIAQAASFDLDLITRIMQATAIEGRIVNQINYRATGGTTFQGVHCDGGPLANTIHDPRWGRTSETYGEDPYLASQMGVTATYVLQNRTANGFMQTAQVTRHYIGYHQASPDIPNAQETISLQWLHDQQLPVYEAFQVDGIAEGIMCGIAAFTSNAWNNSMIPNCVNEYLLTEQLRNQWNSSSFIQSDCCDSITAMYDVHKYFPSLEDAVAGALSAGLSASYGDYHTITAALTQGLTDGKVTESLLTTRIARNLLTRFRLGEFDGNNTDNPFAITYNESLLDGATHRALAREAVAKSIVLLENDAHLLPMDVASLPINIAMIGPFADCQNTKGGYGGWDHDSNPFVCDYIHSYGSYTSQVSTILDAFQEEIAARNDINFQYVQGTNILTPVSTTSIADAASVAAAAELTIIVLGLSSLVERESLDRVNLTLPEVQQQLYAAVAAVVPPSKLVLITVSANGIDYDATLASTALQAWYGGEETGHGVMDVLFGRYNPSARLPLTYYQQPYLATVGPIVDFNMVSQGTGRTYRYYAGPHVSYWFGYGLSYTTFEYASIGVNVTSTGVNVSATVQNVGAFDAYEVAQVYITPPTVSNVTTPLFSLQGFQKVYLLHGGGSVSLTFPLSASQLSVVLEDGTRVVSPGTYTVYISGHLPSDEKGARASNVVSTTFTWP